VKRYSALIERERERERERARERVPTQEGGREKENQLIRRLQSSPACPSANNIVKCNSVWTERVRIVTVAD
jgi:hypothetical protein